MRVEESDEQSEGSEQDPFVGIPELNFNVGTVQRKDSPSDFKRISSVLRSISEMSTTSLAALMKENRTLLGSMKSALAALEIANALNIEGFGEDDQAGQNVEHNGDAKLTIPKVAK
eukprot:1353355-Amorphochlora_amoeboformis.AAC.1